MVRLTEKYSKAILLRKAGKSIRFIAKEFKISSSTASLWCRNIILNDKQKAHLLNKSKNIALLRKYSKLRHINKIKIHKELFNKSKTEVKKLNAHEQFVVGVGLYWAEGFKNLSEGRLGFCNSDPYMIKFMLKWFRNILKIPREDIILRAEFNSIHALRGKQIEDYWSKLTNIPLSQFSKPYLHKTKLARSYPKNSNYYGVLRIKIRKSSLKLVQMRGWITGLSRAF